MEAVITYTGYHPMDDSPYHYRIVTPVLTDYIRCEAPRPTGSYDLPDRLFGEGSGWGTFECDGCGHVFSDRTYPGDTVSCPKCGTGLYVPEGARLKGYEGET